MSFVELKLNFPLSQTMYGHFCKCKVGVKHAHVRMVVLCCDIGDCTRGRTKDKQAHVLWKKRHHNFQDYEDKQKCIFSFPQDLFSVHLKKLKWATVISRAEQRQFNLYYFEKMLFVSPRHPHLSSGSFQCSGITE